MALKSHNMRKILMAATMLAMQSSLGLSGSGEMRTYYPSTPKRPKPEFSEEEKQKLASLHGREKKKYVKELKEKYHEI